MRRLYWWLSDKWYYRSFWGGHIDWTKVPIADLPKLYVVKLGGQGPYYLNEQNYQYFKEHYPHLITEEEN